MPIQIIELEQEHPLKIRFFRSNPYKIEAMITSPIQMLELPNYGPLPDLHMYNII